MTRRALLSQMLLSGFTRLAASPAERQPFPGTPFHAYSRCLPDYLRGLAKRAVEKRNAGLAKLVTTAAIEARQKWVRETLWKLIGGMPERTPLNARTTGSFERERYKVEKVIYESRPNLLVSANLYMQKTGDGPFPAVLFQSGHYNEGKANANYQRCCQGLAQLGFVVLAFDPMGQGERVAYPDSSGTHTRLRDVDSEHTVPGKQMLLFGDTATRYQLWDAMRSLDYLTSLPLVDAKRVGATGHSGGGTLTMLLAAADDRLRAAAPCMGNTENVAALPFLPPGSTDDAEQDFVNSGPAGFDRWDLFYPFAPKPMMIWPSDRDFYATYSPEYISNGWEEYQKLRSVYVALKQPEHLKWSDTPLPHSLAYDSRLLIYNWFTRWLKNSSEVVSEEPAVSPEPASALYATESGSVVRSQNSATPFSLNRSRQIQRTPAALDSLVGAVRPGASMPGKTIGRTRLRSMTVEVLEVASEPAVWLPAWLLTAGRTARHQPVLVVLDPVGSERLWFESDAEPLATGSPVICAADIRGVGALTPEFSPGHPAYAASHRQEESYAWGSLILGKPLLGQRVTDILALVAAVRKHPLAQGCPIRIAAAGKLTVPALFAAALDTGIERLYLSGGLVSFRDVVDSEQYDHPFANFVWGLLNHTDLPEVAASLTPRRVVLAGPVNAKGETVDVSQARDIYAAADRAGILSVQSKAEWSIDRLVSFAAES
ncbi:MAG TPA: acetylxylan esterase [Terriglobales bacterium]|nr:acetylxylan esterase [Terriglobales bacterium]